MENATKALLIAAAILIAIVLISIGVYVVNMGRSAVNNVDMSEQEIMAFNSKFTSYAGNAVRGSQLNALAQAVITSNQAQEATGNFVNLVKDQEYTTDASSRNTQGTTTWTQVGAGNTYKITIQYFKGIVTNIGYKAN